MLNVIMIAKVVSSNMRKSMRIGGNCRLTPSTLSGNENVSLFTADVKHNFAD